VVVNYTDLIGLIGKELTIRELEELMPNIKCEWGGAEDEKITVETTHDRPDLVSTEGIARAIRNYIGLDGDVPAFKKSEYQCTVDKSVIKERPHSRMFVVKGVRLTGALIEQLMQLQEKIHLVYANDRKDASIGVYDLDTFEWPLTYCAKEDYKFTPLGESREMSCKDVLTKTEKGRAYAHLVKGKYPLILDSKARVLSLPPILNSEDTKVTASTKSLFCDVSGLEEAAVEKVAALLACALSERGEVYHVRMAYPERTIESPELKKEKTGVSLSRMCKLIGKTFTADEAIALLKKTGFHARKKGELLEVDVPPYRYDVLHEVDIAEELAIAYGYNNFEPKLPEVATVGKRHPVERISEQAKDALIGAGFQEVLTYILSAKRILDAAPGDEYVELDNPVTDEYNAVRSWLTPRLLDLVSKNRHVPLPHRVFEAEDVVRLEKGAPVTRRNVAALAEESEVTFTQMHSVLDALMRDLGRKYELKPIEHGSFLPGRCGQIVVGGKKAGVIGEVHPRVLEAFAIESPVAGFEVWLDELL
jgi:phenylalanyl-tRNA synthetase beta chain